MAKVPDRAEYRREWAKLELSDRRRIVRAVNRGQTLDNRKEAALAVATARGQKRFWSRAWLLGPIGALFMLGEGWATYAVNALMLTLIMGGMSWFWYRRAERAEEANLAAASGKKRAPRPDPSPRGRGKGRGERKSGGRSKRGGHLPG